MRPLLMGSPFSHCSVALPLLYVMPVVIAALLLPHRGVMIVSVQAFVAECIEGLVSPNDIAIFIADAGPIAIIGVLAVVLTQKSRDDLPHQRVSLARRSGLLAKVTIEGF